MNIPLIRRIGNTEYGQPEEFTLHIPMCCKEGLDSCKHVTQPQEVRKVNVGL